MSRVDTVEAPEEASTANRASSPAAAAHAVSQLSLPRAAGNRAGARLLAAGPASVTALQRSAGNRSVNALLRPGGQALTRATTATDQGRVAPGCKRWQRTIIREAFAQARRVLEIADARLAALLADPAADASAPTAEALLRNFRSDSVESARLVRERLADVRGYIENNWELDLVRCHTDADPGCAEGTYGYVRRSRLPIVLCPDFFSDEEHSNDRARNVIHELAHLLPEVVDPAYYHSRYFRLLTREEAQRNAESYAVFAWELTEGAEIDQHLPDDSFDGCSQSSTRALKRAIAIAQYFNAHAAKGRARSHVYQRAQIAFRSKIDFVCEPNTTRGRCGGPETFAFATSTGIHVCRQWLELPLPEDQAEHLLAAFYAHSDLGATDKRRARLAARARELTEERFGWHLLLGRPENTKPPAIRGEPRVGQNLDADRGDWSGQPTTFRYIWFRCDGDGEMCETIPHATGARYVPTAAAGDAGASLRVMVTASNYDGSASRGSAATAVVVGTDPSCPALPDPAGEWATEPWLAQMRGAPLGDNDFLLAAEGQKGAEGDARGRSVQLVHEVLAHWLCSEPDIAATVATPSGDRYTAVSVAAVRAFQVDRQAKVHGIVDPVIADGIVGPATVDLLDEWVKRRS